uniref:Uncharacterized protein n=1 Tax=Neisseria meningitidis alpha275 TaxID=295996 RepID=C6SLE2_NEIME|nr:hypothetical protein predicted by Glimmer/Critica [Neisseria meningitidis alpha275]
MLLHTAGFKDGRLYTSRVYAETRQIGFVLKSVASV